ncbi:MAG: citrate synthase [Clostridiales bacterium]|jgi:citrate synthase|nr:citrate synthase [Clostridiales bacterium]
MAGNEKKINVSQQFVDELSALAESNNKIPLELYQKYDVKRGLRKSNGTGVLVGLTVIGEVHGYILDEGEKVPVEGRLSYRGIDVQEIVKACQKEKRYGYEEVCYLLLFGQLPNKEQLEKFNRLLGEKRVLPEGFTEDMILKAPSADIMNKLARSVLASYSYDDNPDDININNVFRQSIELIARFPTMAAYGYQAKAHYHDQKSLFIHIPQPELSTAENFLYMIRPDSKYTKLEAETLDLALILHAEHGGGNNSSFATHVVSSTDTDTYSAIAAAVGSLKGPKHGGANIKVMKMMEEIKANVQDWEDEKEIEEYLAKILRKEAFDRTGLIYGMGHAVYTLSDPRAVLLKQKAFELAKEKNREKEFNLYALIEKLAPEVFAKVKNDSKVICANVDLYSGFVYDMLNIPVELYVPIFAISRIVGWCAHRIEEIVSGGRIIRPAYKSVSEKKAYIPLEQR